MKTSELTAKIAGKKRTVKEVDFARHRGHWNSLYRAEMLWLYDNSYISTPMLFTESEFYPVLFELGITPISWTGFKFNSSHFSILRDLSTSKEAHQVLNHLIAALRYKELVRELDDRYEFMGYGGVVSKSLSVRVSCVHGRFSTAGKASLGRGTLGLLYPGYANSIQSMSVGHIFKEVALADLGYEGPITDGMFLAGLTAEQESENILELLQPGIRYTGTEAERLSTLEDGFVNSFGTTSWSTLLSEQGKVLTELVDKGLEPLSLHGTRLYYVGEAAEWNYSVGTYLMDMSTGEELDAANLFSWGSGDFVSEDEAKSLEGGAYGAPSIMKVGTEMRRYYDNEQLAEPYIPYLSMTSSRLTFSNGYPDTFEFKTPVEASLANARVKVENQGVFVCKMDTAVTFSDVDGAAKSVVRKMKW